jgi:hypothetical protein
LARITQSHCPRGAEQQHRKQKEMSHGEPPKSFYSIRDRRRGTCDESPVSDSLQRQASINIVSRYTQECNYLPNFVGIAAIFLRPWRFASGSWIFASVEVES